MSRPDEFKQLLKAGERAFHEGRQQDYLTCLRIAAKQLRHLAKRGDINAALSLEPAWYNALVKKVEAEAHYHQSFGWHVEAFWLAGQKDRRLFDTPVEANRVAFVAHTGSLLGHTEVMLRVLEAWREQAPHIQPYFVSLAGLQPELKARLKRLRVPFAVAPKSAKPTLALKWARHLLAEHAVQTAVWLSTPCWVSYALGLGLAPKQVIWSLKFHAVNLGASVSHIGMTKAATGEVLINGAPWKAFSPPLTVDIQARPPEDVAALRDRWLGRFLFGTLARTEKFNSAEFVRAVVDILRATPDSHYLYTGKERSVALERSLAEAGLADRSTFVGWVDTELYAQALDVFLETFPFGCGITGAQAIENGTRTISLWDEDTLPRFYFPNYNDAACFSCNWLVLDDIEAYVAAAVATYQESRKVATRQYEESEAPPRLARLDAAKPLQLLQLMELPVA